MHHITKRKLQEHSLRFEGITNGRSGLNAAFLCVGRGAGEAGDPEESEDNRERRAARRAEMRERRQVELMLEEGAARPTRASKRPRRGAAGASAAEGGTSGSEFSSGEEEYEASEVRPRGPCCHLSQPSIFRKIMMAHFL